MLQQTTKLVSDFAKTDAELRQALLLVDGACGEAKTASQELDAAMKEQAQERTAMQARVTAAEQAARSAELKANDAESSVVSAREEVDKVSEILPGLRGKLDKVE